MADNLLDKASILLTPTAYNDGRMLSVKPEVAFGEELSTNGDFSNGTTGWSNGSSTLSVVDGKLKILATGAFSYARQNITVVSGKKYKITVNFFYNSLVGNIEVYDGTTNTISEQLSEDGVITLSITPSSTNLRLTLLNRNGVSGDFNYWDNVSVVEDLSGDFTFSRSSAATRVNAQGLVENVQIISSELVSNGNFSQIGTEEVSNGNFSQEGSELVTNGDFATDSDWNIVNNTGTASEIINGYARIKTDGAYTQIDQPNVTIAAKSYKLQYTISESDGGSLGFIITGNQTVSIPTTVGTHIYYFVANSTSIVFKRFSGALDIKIDNVSVKEVGQDWNLGSGWSIGDDKAISDGTSSNLDQSDTFLSGKTYKVVYTIEDYVSGDTRFRFTGTSNENGTLRSANGTYTEYITLTNNQSILRFFGFGILSITNISVKEVGQDWTVQSGTVNITDKAEFVGSGIIYQDALTVNTSYKVTYEVVSIVGTPVVNLYNGSWISAPSTVGTHTVYITMIAPRFYLRNLSSEITIDNISVKEITDDTDLPRINYEGFSYQDALGSELVVNGDGSSTIGWNVAYPNTTLSINNNNLRATANASGAYGLSQILSLDTSKQYLIKATINVDNASGGTGNFRIATSQNLGVNATTLSDTTGTSTTIFTPSASTMYIGVVDTANNSSNYVEIDNISVKEYFGQEVVPDSGCGSWLLEPQSTNLITQSELFSDSSWTKSSGVTITSKQAISPDGNNNGWKFEKTAVSYRSIGQSYTSSSETTFSIFAKKGTLSVITLFANISGGSNLYQRFDLENGIVDAGSGMSSNKIEDYGNGWYRCSSTFTNTNVIDLAYFPDFGEANAGYLYIYGAQLENNSFSTSYIPTSGATSTRLQDIATNSGNSTLINSTEGVLYAEIAGLSSPVDSPKNITISDGTASNYVRIEFYQDGKVYGNVYDGTSVSASFVINQDEYNKIAIQYSSSGSKLYVNGTGVNFASKIFTSNTLNTIQFSNAQDSASYFHGKAKALAVYKEALTDANLRSLTYPNPVATTFDLDFDTIAEQFTFTRGSEATFVNAQGLIESTASNDAPRIDYSTGAKAFLLENQSTNIINYSEDFSQINKLNSTISINNNISPDGTINGNLWLANATSSAKELNELYTVTQGETYTESWFVKYNSQQFVQLVTTSAFFGSFYGNFDLINGTKGNGNFTNFSIKEYSNGWYRISATQEAISSGVGRLGGLRMIDNANAPRGGNITTVGTEAIKVWGHQAENQSFSTSYIPTSGASATRNQELCNNATPVINSEEGTLYAEISALADDGTFRMISISDGTNNNRVRINYTSTNLQIQSRVVVGGVTQAEINKFGFSNITDFTKIALSYKQNEVKFYINGELIGTDTSATMPSVNTFNVLNFDGGNGVNNFLGNTKGLKYYPKALADVQLEDLTTI